MSTKPWEEDLRFVYDGSSDWSYGPAADPQGEGRIGVMWVKGEEEEERWRAIRPLLEQAPAMARLLLATLKTANDSDAWWMTDPGRGGTDAPGIEAVLRAARVIPPAETTPTPPPTPPKPTSENP